MGRDAKRLRWYAAAGACALVVPAAATSMPVASYAGGPDRPAVVEKRVIGHSMRGRPIRVWRLGNPDARHTVVAMATLHGDEPVPRRTLGRLRDGAPIRGVDLWVLPNANPDGLARGSRYNANGVDLNRNFPVRWQRRRHHGRGPASARETRVLMRFLGDVRPDRIVSFHQPLRGVDTLGVKRPAFARRLAENLRLPRKQFDCGGGCHGTMTQWYNRRFPGVAITVEYGLHPRDRYVHRVAPRGLLRSIGARR